MANPGQELERHVNGCPNPRVIEIHDCNLVLAGNLQTVRYREGAVFARF
jgi:predicted protein tyrosine phosphatase